MTPLDAERMLSELLAIRADIATLRQEVATAEPLVYTRREAAKALRISLAQLYRLLATGKLWAQPSGITREALHEYMRRPQAKIPAAMSRGKSSRHAKTEAERGRAMLAAQRRKKAAP
jgi:hypothetical protein